MLLISADVTEKTLVDEEAFVSERVAALNVPLFRTGGDPTVEEEAEMDQFPVVEIIFSFLLQLLFAVLFFIFSHNIVLFS
jgi:hypothetical protein